MKLKQGRDILRVLSLSKKVLSDNPEYLYAQKICLCAFSDDKLCYNVGTELYVGNCFYGKREKIQPEI